MKVVAIDPSTKMGLVALEFQGNTVTTLDAQQVHYPKTDGMFRLKLLSGSVLDWLQAYNPDVIAIEGYSYGSKFNHEIMYSLGTIIRYRLYQEDYVYHEVPPTSVKKFVTGKGNSKKDLVLKAVYKNWGFDSDNDNVCDAYGIAMYALYLKMDWATDKGAILHKPDLQFDHS